MKAAVSPEPLTKVEVSAFGFLNAMASAAICLAYTATTLIIYFRLPETFEKAQWVLLVLASTSRIAASAVFWFKIFPMEMDRHKGNPYWRSFTKKIVLSDPNSIKGSLDFFVDIVIDFALIYLVFKGSASHIAIILVFLISQCVGSLIHGLILYAGINQKVFRKISMVIALMTIYAALEINGFVPPFYAKFAHLQSFEKANQLLYVLGIKCLFSGVSIITHGSIARTIAIATSKKHQQS